MGYRVDLAPNARASCKATTCGKAKFGKGELRMGTWVKGPTFESWSWRHWGCVTPQQIVNARKALLPEGEEDEEGKEVDMSLFDGWEELPDEQKDQVRIAMEVGHVDDEDWKGDVGLNRKGAKKTAATKAQEASAKAKGKSAPAAKKGRKKDDDEEEEAVETEEEPAPKRSTKKTSAASATTPRKRTPAKKSTPTPTPSPSASPEPIKAQKPTTSKKAAKPIPAAEPTRPRSSRATAATPKKYTEVNESADEDSPPTTRKSRTLGRNMKSAKDKKRNGGKGRGKKAGGDSDTEGGDAEVALHADDGVGEDTIDPPAPKTQSKGRDGRRKRGAATALGEVHGELDEEEEQPMKKRIRAKPTPTKKEQSVKTKKATTTPASDKKTKTKAKDSAKETSEAKDEGELRTSVFGGE